MTNPVGVPLSISGSSKWSIRFWKSRPTYASRHKRSLPLLLHDPVADVDILQLSNPVGPLADLEDNLEQPRAFLNTGMHPESGFPLPPTTLQASTPYPRVQGCLTPPLHLALLLLGPCLCSQRGGTNLLFQPTGSMLALPMKVSSLTGRSTRNHCLQSQC